MERLVKFVTEVTRIILLFPAIILYLHSAEKMECVVYGAV
jgi:hypothetical protein